MRTCACANTPRSDRVASQQSQQGQQDRRRADWNYLLSSVAFEFAVNIVVTDRQAADKGLLCFAPVLHALISLTAVPDLRHSSKLSALTSYNLVKIISDFP